MLLHFTFRLILRSMFEKFRLHLFRSMLAHVRHLFDTCSVSLFASIGASMFGRFGAPFCRPWAAIWRQAGPQVVFKIRQEASKMVPLFSQPSTISARRSQGHFKVYFDIFWIPFLLTPTTPFEKDVKRKAKQEPNEIKQDQRHDRQAKVTKRHMPKRITERQAPKCGNGGVAPHGVFNKNHGTLLKEQE